MTSTVAARFRIDGSLGRGGMGEVYRAWDTVLARPVALKWIRPEQREDASASGRFLREARAAAGLRHTNIVTVHDLGEDGGAWYIVMELVEGKTMRAFLHDPTVPLDVRVRWLSEVAAALAAAHAAGVIHRDVKPGNIMIAGDGAVKMLDFGLAKRTGAPRPETAMAPSFRTEHGMVLGTPTYMAPEQARGEVVDARADQFAWGVLGYELLFGSRWEPSLRDAQPPAAGGQLARAIAPILRRATEAQAAARFPSMNDVLGILANARGPAASVDPRSAATRGIPATEPATGARTSAVPSTVGAPSTVSAPGPARPGVAPFFGSGAPTAMSPQASYGPPPDFRAQASWGGPPPNPTPQAGEPNRTSGGIGAGVGIVIGASAVLALIGAVTGVLAWRAHASAAASAAPTASAPAPSAAAPPAVVPSVSNAAPIASGSARLAASPKRGADAPPASPPPSAPPPVAKLRYGAELQKSGFVSSYGWAGCSDCDGEAWIKGVRAHQAAFAACYKANVDVPPMHSSVDFQMNVNAAGVTVATRMTHPTTQHPQLIACVHKVFASIPIPNPAGKPGMIEVEFNDQCKQPKLPNGYTDFEHCL